MLVFVTGATGFVGSAIVRELRAAGHAVLGLTRSEAGAAALEALGAEALRGDIADPASLRPGLASADAVIHTAFDHDFSRYKQACEDDRTLVATMAAALAGSGRPLVVTAGIGGGTGAPGTPFAETDPVPTSAEAPRLATEEAVRAAVAAGANASLVRLPQVHDRSRFGLVSSLVAVARDRGVSAYVGDGSNRWPAAHVTDVARAFRLAAERAEPGAIRHAVAEPGVPLRAIAEAIGTRLGLPVTSLAPEAAAAHFGFVGGFAGRDIVASSAATRAALDWHPTGPTLVEDLLAMDPG